MWARQAGHPTATGSEQSLHVAQLREHEDGGQEADHGADAHHFFPGVLQGDGTGGQDYAGGWDGDHALHPSPGPNDRPGQDRHQQDDGQRLCQRRAQGSTPPCAACGM